MARKKQDDTPSLFGAPTKAEAKTTGHAVASICGAIAGIPASLASASEHLKEARRRCGAAGASAGILTPRHAAIIEDAAEHIHFARLAIEAIIAEGIALPPKKEETELI